MPNTNQEGWFNKRSLRSEFVKKGENSYSKVKVTKKDGAVIDMVQIGVDNYFISDKAKTALGAKKLSEIAVSSFYNTNKQLCNYIHTMGGAVEVTATISLEDLL